MRTLLIFMLLAVTLSARSWAANFSDPVDGVFRGTFGNTITVEIPSLVSKSPTSDDNQNGDLSFQVGPGTAYNNFGQLTDLRQGDLVRVDYSQAPGKDKTNLFANSITRLGPSVVVTPPGATVTNRVITTAPGQTVTTTTTTQTE